MAKRMVLVEERIYDEQMWKRPTTETTKSHLSNNLHSQLDSVDLSDDVKAKLYQKTLKRFLNLKQQVPDLQPVSLNGLKREVVEELKKKKKKKLAHWSAIPIRYSHRKHIPWSKFDNA